MVSTDLRRVYWYTPTILVLGKLRQVDNEFKTNPGGQIERPCHKNQTKQKIYNLVVLLIPLKQLTAFFEITPAVSSTAEAFLNAASALPWSTLWALLVVISLLGEDTVFCATCLKDKISRYYKLPLGIHNKDYNNGNHQVLDVSFLFQRNDTYVHYLELFQF